MARATNSNLAATARNLRKLAKLMSVLAPMPANCGAAPLINPRCNPPRRGRSFKTDLFNSIGHEPSSRLDDF
jgi:hypothetical protein